MADQPVVIAQPGGPISEWHPTRSNLAAWTILSFPLVTLGLIAYLTATGGIASSGTFSFAAVALVVALTVGLAAVHEAIHGVVMYACGGTPEFGVLRIGGVLAGFYTTAPGHRFSRRQYLVAILAPTVILAPLGFPLCMLQFGGYLVVPFALHLAGCTGDVTIAWAVLRTQSAWCEDLRDGTRFWAAGA